MTYHDSFSQSLLALIVFLHCHHLIVDCCVEKRRTLVMIITIEHPTAFEYLSGKVLVLK
jgi:hypothetical protein